jgi:hypothetical protein
MAALRLIISSRFAAVNVAAVFTPAVYAGVLTPNARRRQKTKRAKSAALMPAAHTARHRFALQNARVIK